MSTSATEAPTVETAQAVADRLEALGLRERALWLRSNARRIVRAAPHVVGRYAELARVLELGRAGRLAEARSNMDAVATAAEIDWRAHRWGGIALW